MSTGKAISSWQVKPPERLTNSTLPDIGDEFESALGSSVVEEFVAGHNPSDVLRELVQNEYDGKGTHLDVIFGNDGIHISGNGHVIDHRGWLRLKVLLGTGTVIGSAAEEIIQPKVNGLGSKNFGLRSLFLFGNRIYVRSGGQMAVLDLPKLGTQRVRDTASLGRKGVTIFVPYRTERFQSLEPFTIEREKAALDSMAEDLLHTMVKLVAPGSGRKLTGVTVESVRTGRTLKWRQSASPVPCHLKGVKAFRRVAHLSDTEASQPRVFEELEFQKTTQIREQFRDKKFADYFRVAGNRLRIGISVPLKRGRILTSRLGRFYYPLAVRTGFTGSSVSVSAAFDLDADRTSLIEESGWNDWLIEEASELTLELVRHEWLRRFGADAYIVLSTQTTPSQSLFADTVNTLLRTTPCWPSKARLYGRKVAYREAAKINVVDLVPLEQFLDDEQSLDPRLSSKREARDFVRQCGAPTFTLNSLVRLRCGPEHGSIETQLSKHETNSHYVNYEAALQNTDLQIRMAAVLTEFSNKLSRANRTDLRDTRSTLAADGSLQRACGLFRVDPSIWDVCPAPPVQRLHPALLPYQGIARYSQPFAIDDWVRGVAERCRSGTASEPEKSAAYGYLLAQGVNLKGTTIAVVRRAPIVRDHRDAWAAPASLVDRHAAYFSDLEPVLSAPHPQLEAARELSRRLRFRDRLTGADLIQCAKFVSDHPEMAERFEHVLSRVPQLLTDKVVAQLYDIEFLRASHGGVATPRSVHQKTPVCIACLEPEDGFVTGTNVSLYRRLKCPDRPSSAALLGALSRWRTAGRPPAALEKFYVALVAALRREHVSTAIHQNDPILWIDSEYNCPDDALVGREFPRCFRSAVPQVRGPEALCEAFAALGAHRHPTDAHWGRLVTWFGNRCESGTTVSAADRAALVSMYRARAERGLPENVLDSAACLLDGKGAVYSVSDLRSGRYVENDYPELATELRKASAEIAFAEIPERAASFFATLQLKRLSELATGAEVRPGDQRPAPTWLRGEFERREIARLKRQEFLSALSAIGSSFQRLNESFVLRPKSELHSRFAQIQRITFVDNIAQVFRLGGSTVQVPLEIAALEDNISVVAIRTRAEFYQLLARAIAELLGAKAVVDVRGLQVLVLPLLQCSTDKDIASYLRRQGIEWQQSLLRGDLDAEEVDEVDDEGAETITNDLLRKFAHDLDSPSDTDVRPATSVPKSAALQGERRPTVELPPIKDVRLTVAEPGQSWTTPTAKAKRGTGYGYDWRPTPQDTARDLLVGDRGEEVVYRRELKRVQSLGYEPPEKYVIWTSRNDSMADHDIQSINSTGETIWLEVKSTMGTDGRFFWPKNEFKKALRERDHYELWRVYEAHTTHPSAKCFRDPVSLVNRNALQLELGTLRAAIEPMEIE